MLLLSFVSMGQTVMASVIPKWCIAKSKRDYWNSLDVELFVVQT